jgi:TonB-dependent SusC/RagA subfamily outer membrane receptor
MTLLEWMLQATVLCALFGAAAVLLERATVCRRWVWIATLGLSGVVPFLALFTPSLWPEWTSWRVVPVNSISPLPAGFAEGAESPIARRFVVNPVLAAWAVLSLLCGARYLAGWLRLHRLSRGCVPVRLAGCDLLLSERLGPAVIGLWRARVVAPRWMTTVGAARQQMIVLHELEHLRARDHWVLAFAPAVAVLMPWSVPVWYQLRRLRLAVELDCDARVLAHGVPPLDYGGLLLDVAASAVVLAAPALAEPRSHLERRLQAVAGRQRRPGLAQSLTLASSAAAALLSGCFVAAPVHHESATTAAASTAVEVLPDVALSTTTTAPTMSSAIVPREYGSTARNESIDATRTAAAASTGGRNGAGEVASVGARRRARNSEPAGLPITDATAPGVSDDRVMVQVDNSAPSVNATSRSGNGALKGPLIVVDGVIDPDRTIADLRLEPEAIESIEVLKGAAAAERYGPRGVDGVVMITTRRGGAGG